MGGNPLRTNPIKVALIAAVAATTLAGCQGDDEPVTAAPPPASVAPAASPSPSANGIEGQKADEILKRAKAALKEAKSYRAKGTLNQNGEKTAIDLKVSGRDFTTSLSYGGKAKVELLSTGGKGYLRPNKEFWIMATDAEQGALLARAIGDRWVAGADRDRSFADLFTLGTLDGLLAPEGTLGIGAVKEVNGIRTIGLMDSGDIFTKLYVASTGKPYPLQLTGAGDAEVTFSDFGATFPELKAPAKSEVVDLGKLAG